MTQPNENPQAYPLGRSRRGRKCIRTSILIYYVISIQPFPDGILYKVAIIAK